MTQVTGLWKLGTAGAQTYVGVGVDTNPANGTYGLIYVGIYASKTIEIYYPDGTKKGTLATGFAGANSPWSLAISYVDGRIYTCDRSKMLLASFDPITFSKVTGAAGGFPMGHNMAVAATVGWHQTGISPLYYVISTVNPGMSIRGSSSP